VKYTIVIDLIAIAQGLIVKKTTKHELMQLLRSQPPHYGLP